MGVLCPPISYSKYPIVGLIEIPTYVTYEKQIEHRLYLIFQTNFDYIFLVNYRIHNITFI